MRIDLLGSATDAVTTVELALLPDEVKKVENVLRTHRQLVQLGAVHNHMLNTDPAIIFVHFQGRGNASDLMRVVRAALDQTRLFARR